VSVLLLLDSSTKAFDNVDHDLLCATFADRYAYSRSAVSIIIIFLSESEDAVRQSQWMFFTVPVGCSRFSAWTFAIFIVHKWHRRTKFFL
jgi:hypothetical protein